MTLEHVKRLAKAVKKRDEVREEIKKTFKTADQWYITSCPNCKAKFSIYLTKCPQCGTKNEKHQPRG